MKKFIITTLALLILATSAWAYEFDKDKTYDVNFKNVTMKEFISFVASFTGTNIVYNEADLRGTVSISSQYPMTASDIMEIFHTTLKSNNLSAIREDGYIRVTADKDMAGYNDKLKLDGIEPDNFVTTIIYLRNYHNMLLSAAFTRIKSKHGHVEPVRGVNALIVKDFSDKIEKMQQIAYQLDMYVDNLQLYSVPLNYSEASKIEQQVMKMFTELMKNGLTGHVPIVISDDSANVIIFMTDTDGYKKIQYLISQLDVQNENINTLPRVFYLKYAKAEDVEKVLNKLFVTDQAGISAAANRAIAIKSSVSSDKSTNSIIALGDQQLYTNLENMIDKLDIARKQVYVEALILETSLDRGDKFGVEWFGAGASGDTFGFVNSANSNHISGIMGPIADGKAPDMSGLPGGFSGGIIGDLVSFNGIKFPNLSAFMTAVRSDSGINIVSNPQILTLDNEEAEVFVGENRPYVTSEKFDSNNNPIQTFDYRNVGIRLTVTPHIAGNDIVQLDIDQEVNKISPATFNASSPVTLTRTTKTKVQLYDKSIMLISGLMKDDASVVDTGIPILSSIPILGYLFKSTTTTYEKTNLMVFITTHIIHTYDDMNEVMDKRINSSVDFNSQVSNILTNKVNRKDDAPFIPLQIEVFKDRQGTADEEKDKSKKKRNNKKDTPR